MKLCCLLIKIKWKLGTLKSLDKPLIIRKIFLKRRFAKKLEKLNDGNYASIDGEINLAIVSVFRDKPDKIIKDIQQKYVEVRDLYNQTFKKIFVLFSDAIFEIDGDIIKRYDLFEDDLKMLENDFKEIIKNKKY